MSIFHDMATLVLGGNPSLGPRAPDLKKLANDIDDAPKREGATVHQVVRKSEVPTLPPMDLSQFSMLERQVHRQYIAYNALGEMLAKAEQDRLNASAIMQPPKVG